MFTVLAHAQDHKEVELLLENFLQDINTLANVLESMDTRLTNTNSLIQVLVCFSIPCHV